MKHEARNRGKKQRKKQRQKRVVCGGSPSRNPQKNKERLKRRMTMREGTMTLIGESKAVQEERSRNRRQEKNSNMLID